MPARYSYRKRKHPSLKGSLKLESLQELGSDMYYVTDGSLRENKRVKV
jgi:hypothetical protein